MALTRGASAALVSEMARQGWHPTALVYVDWPSGAVRAHTGAGTISFGGYDWLGVGPYGRIELPAESATGEARRTVLTLLGSVDSLLSQAREQARARTGEIWFGAVTERAGNVLVADPIRLWRGTCDAISFQLTRQSERGLSVEAALQVMLVSGPPMRRNASQFHSLEDHKANHSATDTAGRLIQHADTDAQTLTWPE